MPGSVGTAASLRRSRRPKPVPSNAETSNLARSAVSLILGASGLDTLLRDESHAHNRDGEASTERVRLDKKPRGVQRRPRDRCDRPQQRWSSRSVGCAELRSRGRENVQEVHQRRYCLLSGVRRWSSRCLRARLRPCLASGVSGGPSGTVPKHLIAVGMPAAEPESVLSIARLGQLTLQKRTVRCGRIFHAFADTRTGPFVVSR